MKSVPEVFLKHIKDSIEDIENYTKDMEVRSFLAHENVMVQDAVVRKIEIIGEATRNLSNEFKQKYPDIPWIDIMDMRNNLIHEYFGVDLELVWEVVKKDIPELKTHIEKILKTML